MQRAAPPNLVNLAEFDAAITRAAWRARWRRLALWSRVALGRETCEARAELLAEEAHLAALREDRRFLAHARGRRRGRAANPA